MAQDEFAAPFKEWPEAEQELAILHRAALSRLLAQGRLGAQAGATRASSGERSRGQKLAVNVGFDEGAA
jgi:hypothetical protein